jgi:hypothetical protein
MAGPARERGRGPPPLAPFGLVLHHDGSWSHEGVPLRNRRLRAAFDRGVRYLPDVRKYVVQVGRFRGEIEPEEAAFFVRGFDAASGRIRLSDGSEEPLEVASLRPSPRDGALLCRVKRDLAPEGLPARFGHAAQAELLLAVDAEADPPCLRIGGERRALPPL